MNHSIEPSELSALIKRHGLLQSDIAIALDISQGQVSRLLSGSFKKPGRSYEKLCNYVINAIKKVDSGLINNNQTIMEAITSVWDGTEHQAKVIASVIRSLGPFCKKGY